MPTFGSATNTNIMASVKESGTAILIVFVVLAVILIVAVYMYLSGPGSSPAACPTKLHRRNDGTLVLHPSGQTFVDMNAFQQWWHSSGGAERCPIPILTGPEEVDVMVGPGATGGGGRGGWPDEETYAKTPIYKVDDYEFSRIFGYERNGHMEIPKQNFNKILIDRFLDWADRPLTSDERREKYAGLREGFTAAGDLKSEEVVRHARARFGERNHHDEDQGCKVTREEKEVAKLVARAYESDPAWEPVVTKVGANHWEVNELKPRARQGRVEPIAVEERVVDTNNDAVDIRFRYREKGVIDDAIDPYFSGEPSPTGDPYQGTVPGMERMFGPTFDHARWY